MSDKKKHEHHHATNDTSSGEEVTLSRAEYEKLLQTLKDLESRKEQLLVSAAEFDNARKRLAKEREEIIKFGQENLIRKLLPILDNLERALAHASEENSADNLKSIVKGVQMVLKQFEESLKGQGLVRMKTVGEIFNPNFHEAIAFVEEKGQEDEILEEIEPGYLLNDRVIKAAKVKIRIHRGPSGSEDAANEKEDEIT